MISKEALEAAKGSYDIEEACIREMKEYFDEEQLKIVSAIRSDHYYVNMMIAWYFAEALVKQPEAALKHIENRTMAKWTHNKAIQKAVESYRISEDMKIYLKSIKLNKIFIL